MTAGKGLFRGARGRSLGGTSGPPATPVIALRMKSLLQWVVERVMRFPRERRFTVGDRLIDTSVDVMQNLVEASCKRDKHAELAAASRGLVRARVLLRLAHGLHCVSEAQHRHFAKERDAVGQMPGGWIRAGTSRCSTLGRGLDGSDGATRRSILPARTSRVGSITAEPSVMIHSLPP